MTATLPKPTYYLASNGRLMQVDGDVDCTGKRLTIYTEAQLKAYGAAEYKRGIEAARELIDGYPHWLGVRAKEEIKAAISKLGETS